MRQATEGFDKRGKAEGEQKSTFSKPSNSKYMNQWFHQSVLFLFGGLVRQAQGYAVF